MRSHQIAKHNSYFRLQRYILRKQFFSRQEKAKAVDGKKNIHIINRITKLLVRSFNKYSRNEIITRYQQCRGGGGGGGTTRPLPRDGGAEELRGDPTVGPHPKVWTIDRE